MNKQKNIPSLRFPEFEGEWEKKKLGDIGDFIGGGTPPTKNIAYWSGNIPWVSSSDLIDESIYQIRITRFISENAIANSATKLIPEKSILIVSRVGVGKIAINETKICTSQDFTSLVPKKDNYIFLAYLIKIKTNRLLEFNQGTSIKGFVKSDLQMLGIELPSLPEQEKMANFFTKIDEKIVGLKKKKSLLEEYKKGVMQQLFRQPEPSTEAYENEEDHAAIKSQPSKKSKKSPFRQLRFKRDDGGDFPDWEVRRLGEIAVDIMYGMNSASIAFDGINKYLRITDIDDSSRTFLPNPLTSPEGIIEEKYKLKEGDIVFTRTGASVGKSYLYNKKDGNLLFAGFLIKFSLYNVDPSFIFYQTLLGSYDKWVVKMSMRSGQPGLNAEEYKDIDFTIASLPEQTKIANFLSALDEKINGVQVQIEKMEIWKKGLLQSMFV
ncbi:MAG: restriction endonuclease subunit S [Saprospiraceae bacterium]